MSGDAEHRAGSSSANYIKGTQRFPFDMTSITSTSCTITPTSYHPHPHSPDIHHHSGCWYCQNATESQIFQSSDNLVNNDSQVDKRGTTTTQLDENHRYGPDPYFDSKKKDPLRPMTWIQVVCKVWIWETLGIILSISLMATIYALLGSFNGKMTSSWILGINLTTLVAFLSTIIRATIMAISAGIISQEKWTWFWNSDSMPATRARPLSEMQAFDDASRGPVGSVLLMRTVFRKPALLLILSIGVLSIFIGPLSQQAITVVECSYEDPTRDAFIPTVQTLGYQDNVPSISVKGTIISSLANPNSSGSMIRATCSSGNCTFPTFRDEDRAKDVTHRSIAMCSYCVDVSSHIKNNHSMKPESFHYANKQSGAQVTIDTWYLPNEQSVQYEAADNTDNNVFMDVRAANLDISWAKPSLDQKFIDLSAFSLMNTTILMSEDSHQKGGAKIATVCTLYPCIQSYTASINKGELSETIVSSQTLPPYGQWFRQTNNNDDTDGTAKFIYPSDMMAIQTPCTVDGEVYTKKNLSSAPRMQTISRYEYSGTTPTGHEMPSHDVGVPMINISAPAECLFGISYGSWFAEMQDFLQTSFTGTCRFASGNIEGITQAGNVNNCTHFWLEAMHSSKPSLAGVQSYMDSFTQSLTRRFRMAAREGGQIVTRPRSKTYVQEDYGANMTGVSGTVWNTTTCFAVNWWWLLLPSLLTGLTAAVLAWTLIRGFTVSGGGAMAWKGSLLPFLYYRDRVVPLVTDHGYEFSFVGDRGKDLTDLKKLKDDAKHVRVVFQGS